MCLLIVLFTLGKDLLTQLDNVISGLKCGGTEQKLAMQLHVHGSRMVCAHVH